jgi:hypothetical protein
MMDEARELLNETVQWMNSDWFQVSSQEWLKQQWAEVEKVH